MPPVTADLIKSSAFPAFLLNLLENDDIISLNIPTGIPLIYELSDDLNPIKSYYLGNKEEIEKAISSVKNQAKT